MRQTVGIHQVPEMQRRLRSWLQGGSHPQPVLWFKFGRRKGDSILDSSKNTNTGTREGATWTTGLIDNALDFDGLTDYVEVADASSLKPDLITILLWFKMDTIPNAAPRIIDKMDDTAKDGYMIYILQSSGKLRAALGNGTTLRTMEGLIPVAGTWYFVGVTHDGTTTKLYVNTETPITASLTGLTHTTNKLRISDSVAYDGTRCFDGIIDEVRIYDVAFTAREIARAYRGVF